MAAGSDDRTRWSAAVAVLTRANRVRGRQLLQPEDEVAPGYAARMVPVAAARLREQWSNRMVANPALLLSSEGLPEEQRAELRLHGVREETPGTGRSVPPVPPGQMPVEEWLVRPGGGPLPATSARKRAGW